MIKVAFILLLLVSCTLSASAQTIEVTAVGQVTSTVGTFDPNVHVGDPVTLLFDIALDTPGSPDYPGIPSSGAIMNNYTEYNAFASFTAGSFSMASTSCINSATVYSTGAGYYGYQERSTFNQAVPMYSDIVLLSRSTPAVAPTTSLASIQAFPVSDFDDEAYANFIDNNDEFGVNASLTSYTVQTIAAPEPSSYPFVSLALLALASSRLKRRFRETRV